MSEDEWGTRGEGDDVIGLSLGDKPLDVLCLGAHPDDVEIGCGATLLRLADRSDPRATGVVLTGSAARARRGGGSLDRFIPGAKVETRGCPTAGCRSTGAGEAGPGGRGRALRPGHRVRAPRRRRPPGPPAGRDAGEHRLARRADPALRDPQVGRRPRRADALRPAHRRAGTTQGRAPERLLPHAGGPRLVGRRAVPRADADPRRRVPGAVRGGLLLVEGRAGPRRKAARGDRRGLADAARAVADAALAFPAVIRALPP